MEPLSIVGAAAFAASVVAYLRPLRLRSENTPSTLFGLQSLDDEPENPVADICFVHGLNKDPEGTWLSTDLGGKRKFWWPEDLQKQTNARILLYKYSTVAPTAEYLARRTLYHQAQNLVESLADARKEHPRRPLIFVAHSLGGIVVKSGLILSSQSFHAREIALSTTGIVFLGTPHRIHGHLASSPDSILRTIARANGLDRKVLRHLDNQSMALQSHLEPFEVLSSDILTATFFEKRGTKPFGIIVSPPTANPGTRYYKLDSNHADLARFRSPKDKNYTLVLSIIQEFCDKATSIVERKSGNDQQGSVSKLGRNHKTNRESLRVPTRLPSRSARFTGREDALSWIEDSLLVDCPSTCSNNCHTVALYGQGGIGKTQIALEFAYRFNERFSSMLWIPCGTRTSIEREFVEIAHTLKLLNHETEGGDSATEIALSVLEWLKGSRNTDWLLVFDDICRSTEEVVEKLIPSTTCVHGHVLITSREPLRYSFAKTYEVDTLKVEESRALLRTYLDATHANDSELDMLSEAFERHPLALGLGAEFMQQTQVSPRRYIDLHQKQDEHPPKKSRASRTIGTPIQKGMERISGMPAELLLSMCCMLSLEIIPLWIFEEGSKSFSSKRVLRESLEVLETSALIKQQPSHTHVLVHHLIRNYGRKELPADIQSDACRELCETASYVVVALKQTRPKYSGTHEFEKELVELGVNALSFIQSYRPSSLEWDVNLEELGKFCQAHRKFSEATQYYELFLGKNRGPETMVSRTKLRLAITRRNTGDHSELGSSPDDENLDAQFRQAVKAAPDDHTMQELRSLNREQQNPTQELEVLRMIIEAQERRSGSLSLSTLESLEEISNRLVDQGLLEEAEARLRRVLMSYQKLHGAHHPSATRIAERLSSVYISLGRLDDAAMMCEAAISDYDARLGRDHPSTQRCLSELAFVYSLQGRYEEAETLFVDSSKALSRTQGPDHPDVLRLLRNWALNRMQLGNTREGEQMLSDVLNRMEAHPEIYTMQARHKIAIQLVRAINGDLTLREGDIRWNMARQMEDKYELESVGGKDVSY